MLIGLVVGAIVSPPLIAQSNAVFHKVVCREIEVVDENGRQAILISSGNGTALVTIFDSRSGVPGVMLGSSETMNNVHITDKRSGIPGSIFLQSHKGGANGVGIYNIGSNANAVMLGSTDESNYVSVSDKQGKETVTLRSAVFVGNSVTVYDNQGKESVVLSGTAAHNSLNVFNKKSGIPGINILSGEGANGVAILDQQGEIVIVLASNDKKNRVVVIDKTGKEMSLGD